MSEGIATCRMAGIALSSTLGLAVNNSDIPWFLNPHVKRYEHHPAGCGLQVLYNVDSLSKKDEYFIFNTINHQYSLKTPCNKYHRCVCIRKAYDRCTAPNQQCCIWHLPVSYFLLEGLAWKQYFRLKLGQYPLWTCSEATVCCCRYCRGRKVDDFTGAARWRWHAYALSYWVAIAASRCHRWNAILQQNAAFALEAFGISQ